MENSIGKGRKLQQTEKPVPIVEVPFSSVLWDTGSFVTEAGQHWPLLIIETRTWLAVMHQNVTYQLHLPLLSNELMSEKDTISILNKLSQQWAIRHRELLFYELSMHISTWVMSAYTHMALYSMTPSTKSVLVMLCCTDQTGNVFLVSFNFNIYIQVARCSS